MRVCFFRSDKPRERLLSEAFAEGVKACGDEIEVRPLKPEVEVAENCDVACMVGVKSKELFQAHWRAGVHTVMLDKGYTRHSTTGGVRAWEYWRVAVDGHQPTHYLGKANRPMDRLERLGLIIHPWREEGDHVVFAGSSAKYHDFHSLNDPTSYASKIIKRLSKATERRIIYRPKPSWKEAVPIAGSEFSNVGGIMDVILGAHALVTHGSSAVFEAVLYGVPCVVLGEAVAAPISSREIADVESPRLASMPEREQWFANLAYCQWTLREMLSGEAWTHIRPQIYG